MKISRGQPSLGNEAAESKQLESEDIRGRPILLCVTLHLKEALGVGLADIINSILGFPGGEAGARGAAPSVEVR